MFRSLPDHLFVSSYGDLFDCRKENWHESPLRAGYSYHFRTITNNNDLKATLRAAPYAWPGGYQLFMIDAQGTPMSFEGVEKEFKRSRGAANTFEFPLSVHINYEDFDLYCSITQELIPAAYSE